MWQRSKRQYRRGNLYVNLLGESGTDSSFFHQTRELLGEGCKITWVKTQYTLHSKRMKVRYPFEYSACITFMHWNHVHQFSYLPVGSTVHTFLLCFELLSYIQTIKMCTKRLKGRASIQKETRKEKTIKFNGSTVLNDNTAVILNPWRNIWILKNVLT